MGGLFRRLFSTMSSVILTQSKLREIARAITGRLGDNQTGLGDWFFEQRPHLMIGRLRPTTDDHPDPSAAVSPKNSIAPLSSASRLCTAVVDTAAMKMSESDSADPVQIR